MSKNSAFIDAYKNLNKAQKEAVDTIDGPVMVVAGPGTGKTQVLALRIANILTKTDTPADGILCLTFTNSGVRAMRERLTRLIGPDANRIKIATFHSFGGELLEEFYEALLLPSPPRLLDDHDVVILFDHILENHDWKYLRTRSGGAYNFRDLKSLISLLKREGIKPEDFMAEILNDISRIENDSESLSSRGPSKGTMKQSALDKIERLNRTKEVVRFYELYESEKIEHGTADYDDILEMMVRIAKSHDDIRATIRERYLYVLVDEHQDSSGVQNQFLEEVWAGVEHPNIFTVGDDRQLIYGFGGASISHFERFREVFPTTKLIALAENYRSTQAILDSADKLLESSLVKGKLVSTSKESHPLNLVEASYPRDEILSAGISIKEDIKRGVSPDDCVILVPKNAQVRGAMTILSDLGLPVSRGDKMSSFDTPEMQSILSAFRVCAYPYSAPDVANLLLDRAFGVPTLIAHKCIKEYGKNLSVENLGQEFKEVFELKKILLDLIYSAQKKDVYSLTQEIGEEIFFKRTTSHNELQRQIEVVRTMLHLSLTYMEKNPRAKLSDFVAFIDRLIEYGQDISLAVFGAQNGVKVMTLHASKGLEFHYVWIAHMDESSLMKGKHMGFTLPDALAEKVSKKDELSARRELYVAITRARRHCTISYSQKGYSGGDQKLASIVSDLPQDMFIKTTALETEKKILKHDPKAYVASEPITEGGDVLENIREFVRDEYAKRKVAVTHLNNFFTCPWTWYFRNFVYLPEPENESAQFGSLIHSAIEEVFKNRKITKNELEAFYEKKLDSLRIFDSKIRNRFIKDAKEMIAGFIKTYLPNIEEDSVSEKEPKEYVDPSVPNLTITGKIDLVEMLGSGNARVTDFKTNRKAKTAREIEKVDDEGRMSDMLRQLAMYSYLLKHDKSPTEVTASRLLFMEADSSDKDALYETKITDEHIELLRKDISDFDSNMQSGEWTTRTCHAKNYGTQKECKYCALAKRVV
ncbi:MAG: ATP-dependent helicase [Candidatus Pacebacteria bacterium]|nr:ATP-dependent helicase [Candidatus Paceibacterota bacterium]